MAELCTVCCECCLASINLCVSAVSFGWCGGCCHCTRSCGYKDKQQYKQGFMARGSYAIPPEQGMHRGSPHRDSPLDF